MRMENILHIVQVYSLGIAPQGTLPVAFPKETNPVVTLQSQDSPVKPRTSPP